MATHIVMRDGTWKEFVHETMIKTLEHYLESNGFCSYKDEIPSTESIKRHFIHLIKFLKNLRFEIIKKLIIKPLINLQDITFITQNILLQTTYYKLNTTRP